MVVAAAYLAPLDLEGETAVLRSRLAAMHRRVQAGEAPLQSRAVRAEAELSHHRVGHIVSLKILNEFRAELQRTVAELLASRSQDSAPAWSPMKTAPRTGERFAVYVHDCDAVVIAFYRDGRLLLAWDEETEFTEPEAWHALIAVPTDWLPRTFPARQKQTTTKQEHSHD